MEKLRKLIQLTLLIIFLAQIFWALKKLLIEYPVGTATFDEPGPAELPSFTICDYPNQYPWESNDNKTLLDILLPDPPDQNTLALLFEGPAYLERYLLY